MVPICLVCFYKDVAFFAGLYPEGNLAGETYNDVIQFGDENFFEKLALFGLEHLTSRIA